MRCYKMLQYVRRDCQRLCRRLEQSRWALHPVILAPGTPEMLGFVESMGPSMALQCLALWIPLVSICQYVSIEAPWSSHHHQGAAASQRELFRLSPFLEHVRRVDHLYKTVSSWCSSWNATCRRTLWTHGSPTAVQLSWVSVILDALIGARGFMSPLMKRSPGNFDSNQIVCMQT